MRNTTQRPHTVADTEIQAELAQLHAKLDLVRQVREREARRKAVEALNRREMGGTAGNRLAVAMAALLVIATALAGAVSLAIFLLSIPK